MSEQQRYRVRLRLSALAVGVAGGLAVMPASAAPGTVNWTTYLRSGAGEQFAALDQIDPETQVEVLSCGDGWCRVVSGHATGYIQQSMLSKPDIHRKPTGASASAECFTAKLNGPPRSQDDVRICRK